jgi:hypothetical protein
MGTILKLTGTAVRRTATHEDLDYQISDAAHGALGNYDTCFAGSDAARFDILTQPLARMDAICDEGWFETEYG